MSLHLSQPRDERGRLRSPYDATAGMRFCPGCETEKPVEEFGPKKRGPSGEILKRQTRCLICAAAHVRAWRAANREHDRQQNRERYRRDPERIRRWALQNPQKRNANRRRYYQRHHAHILAYAIAYQAANRDLRTGRERMWRAVEQGQASYPQGFVLVRIEDANDWRPARPGVPLRRCESALAEFVHDGERWKAWACPVVDSTLRHWLPRLRRGLKRREGRG